MKDAIYNWLASRIANNALLRECIIAYGFNRHYSLIKHEDGSPYMNRWWLMPRFMIGTDERGQPCVPDWLPFRVRLHHIVTEDYDRDLHDHPADYRTLLIAGWYIEQDVYGNERRYEAGSSRSARAETFHRITQVSPGGAWTIFIMGKKRVEWGFMPNVFKVPHRQYWQFKKNANEGQMQNIDIKPTPLHKRAAAFLSQHGDVLQDTNRSDDLVFLNATIRRNVIRGDEKHNQRMDELEAEFSDISSCIKSNRS